MKLVPLLLLIATLLHISSSHPTTSSSATSTPFSKEDVCLKLKCTSDEVCDWEAGQCVNKQDMTEGRPCRDHYDCRDDHICYGERCILFHGRH